MSPAFVHLHLHSEYSLTDSTIRIAALVETCVREDMPAVALTDQSNLFALVKFYKAAEKAGIKHVLITGSHTHHGPVIELTDEEFVINARQIVNATGVWTDDTQALVGERGPGGCRGRRRGDRRQGHQHVSQLAADRRDRRL